MPLHTSVDLLVPALQSKCWDFLEKCQQSKVLLENGYKVILLETLRDLAVQMAYAMRGRLVARPEDNLSSEQWIQKAFQKAGLWQISKDETTRPNTWTLDSKHLEGKAFDAVPEKNGVVDWNAPETVWEELHRIGLECGLICGADFPGKKQDRPHYELA